MVEQNLCGGRSPCPAWAKLWGLPRGLMLGFRAWATGFAGARMSLWLSFAQAAVLDPMGQF
jgi:hypothetical protein